MSAEPIRWQVKNNKAGLVDISSAVGMEYAWTARCTNCGTDYDFKVALPNGTGVTQFEAKCMACDRMIVDSRTLGIYARITPAKHPTQKPIDK